MRIVVRSLVALVAVWLFMSCRGKEGPQGPPGPPGPAFSLPKSGYIRGQAIIVDSEGKRYTKDFSYEYGDLASLLREGPDSFRVSFERYADGNLSFSGPFAYLHFLWQRSGGNDTAESVYGFNFSLLLSGTVGGTDTLRRFDMYASSPWISVRRLAITSDRRITGEYVAVNPVSFSNPYPDTVRGSFDVPFQVVQRVQRVGR